MQRFNLTLNNKNGILRNTKMKRGEIKRNFWFYFFTLLQRNTKEQRDGNEN